MSLTQRRRKERVFVGAISSRNNIYQRNNKRQRKPSPLVRLCLTSLALFALIAYGCALVRVAVDGRSEQPQEETGREQSRHGVVVTPSSPLVISSTSDSQLPERRHREVTLDPFLDAQRYHQERTAQLNAMDSASQQKWMTLDQVHEEKPQDDPDAECRKNNWHLLQFPNCNTFHEDASDPLDQTALG